MKVAYQPWWSDPIHSEETYALGMRGDGTAPPNSTIFADRAKAARWQQFLDSLSEDRALLARQGCASGEDIMQWYAEYGSQQEQSK